VCIFHIVAPSNSKDAAKAAQVEALFGVCCTGLAAVQENVDDTGILHCEHGLHCEL